MTFILICSALGFIAAGLTIAFQKWFHPGDISSDQTPWKLIICCFAASACLAMYGGLLYAGISEKLPDGILRLPFLSCLLLSACLLGISSLRCKTRNCMDHDTCQRIVRITGTALFTFTLLLVALLSMVLFINLYTGQYLYDAAQILFTAILTSIPVNVHQAAQMLLHSGREIDEFYGPYEKELHQLKKRISHN